MRKYKRFLLISFFLITVTSCMDIDSSVANTVFGLTALKYEYLIALFSMFGGYTLILGGIVLMILGITGSIDWIVEIDGITSKLINASPGLIMVIVGAFIVLKSRMKIKVTKESEDKAK